MICLIGVKPLAPEMTLTSGDMHDNKARMQSAAKMARRMISRIAAFLIIYKMEKRRKRKRSLRYSGFGRGHNLLSILILFRNNVSS